MATTVPIQAARYNTLRNRVNKVLGVSQTSAPDFGYGQNFSTSPVTGDYEVNFADTDKVSAIQYEDLYIDLIRVRAHQVGAASVTIDSFVEGDYENNPSSADLIELAYIQSLENLATNIETDRFLIDETSQASVINLEDSLNNQIVSIRENSIYGGWNGTIDHVFQVAFPSAQSRRQFFNAGGQIRLSAGVDYTGSQAKTVDWQTELAAMGVILFKASETVSSLGVGSGTSIGNNNLTSTYRLCYSKSGGASYANNDYSVYARTVNDSVLQIKVEFNDLGPNNATFGIDESVLGDFSSSVELLQPSGTVSINGVEHDTVVITELPVGSNVSELFTTVLSPTYALTTTSTSVNEGGTVSITLTTTAVASGTLVPYTITGINSSDLSSGSITGNFTIGTTGTSTLSFVLSNDATTEGAETMILSLNNGRDSISININDTSTTPVSPPPSGGGGTGGGTPAFRFSISPTFTEINYACPIGTYTSRTWTVTCTSGSGIINAQVIQHPTGWDVYTNGTTYLVSGPVVQALSAGQSFDVEFGFIPRSLRSGDPNATVAFRILEQGGGIDDYTITWTGRSFYDAPTFTISPTSGVINDTQFTATWDASNSGFTSFYYVDPNGTRTDLFDTSGSVTSTLGVVGDWNFYLNTLGGNIQRTVTVNSPAPTFTEPSLSFSPSSGYRNQTDYTLTWNATGSGASVINVYQPNGALYTSSTDVSGSATATLPDIGTYTAVLSTGWGSKEASVYNREVPAPTYNPSASFSPSITRINSCFYLRIRNAKPNTSFSAVMTGTLTNGSSWGPNNVGSGTTDASGNYDSPCGVHTGAGIFSTTVTFGDGTSASASLNIF